MRRTLFYLAIFLIPLSGLAATRDSMLNCAAYMSLARQAPDTPYVLEQLGRFGNEISPDSTKPKFFGHLTVTDQSRPGKHQKVVGQIRGIRHMQFRQGESTPIKTVAFAVQGKEAIQRFVEQVETRAQLVNQILMAHPTIRQLILKNRLASTVVPPGALVFAGLGYLLHDWTFLTVGIGLLIIHNPIPMILYLLPDRARSKKWNQILAQVSHFPDKVSEGDSFPAWSYWTQTYRLENQAIEGIWDPVQPAKFESLGNQDHLDHRGLLWRWFEDHIIYRWIDWSPQETRSRRHGWSKGWVVTDELLWFNPTIGQPELLVVVRASDQPLKKAMPVRVKAKAPAPTLAPQSVPVPNP